MVRGAPNVLGLSVEATEVPALMGPPAWDPTHRTPRPWGTPPMGPPRDDNTFPYTCAAGGLGSLGSSLSGIDGGDDTGLRKGSLGGPAATSRKGSNLQGDDSRGPGKEA